MQLFYGLLTSLLVQPDLKSPPRDKVRIFENGNVKGVFVGEKDIAAFTISAVDDPRTLTKVVYLRPQGNVYTPDWTGRALGIGKKLDKIYVPEEEILKKIRTYPDNMNMVYIYTAFVKGHHTHFDITSSHLAGWMEYIFIHIWDTPQLITQFFRHLNKVCPFLLLASSM